MAVLTQKERSLSSRRTGSEMHHFCIIQLFITLVLSPIVCANVPTTVAFTSSPLPEMSLLLETVDSFSPESWSVVLGGEVEASLNLTFASNITELSNSSVIVSFPGQFILASSDGNVSVSTGDNLVVNSQNYSFVGSELVIEFGAIQSTNASSNMTEDDMIKITFNLLLNEPLENIGSSLCYNADVIFTDMGDVNETTQSVASCIEFAGPGVVVDSQNSGFTQNDGDFNPDRETSLDILLDVPQHNLTGVTVFIELYSPDTSSLDVDLASIVITPDGSNVEYSSPTLPSAFSCSGDTCTLPGLSFGGVSADNGTLLIQVHLIISQAPLSAGDVVYMSTSMALNDASFHLYTTALSVVLPDLTFSATISPLTRTVVEDGYTYQYVLFSTTVSHTATSTSAAYQWSYYNPIDTLDIDLNTMDPDPIIYASDYRRTSSSYRYQPGTLQVGDTSTFSYEARLTKTAVDDNLETDIVFDSELTWSSIPSSEETSNHAGLSYGPTMETLCISQVVSYEESLLYNHGLPALFFFVALLLSFLLVVLACFVYAKTAAGGIYSMVQPEGTLAKSVTQRGLIINHRAGQTGLDMVEEYSSVTANESIVVILMQKDKAKKVLDFEDLDVVGTITTDIQLEDQRTSMMTDMFVMLLTSWSLKDSFLSHDLSQKLSKKYQRETKDTLKKLDDEYRRDSRELIKALSQENQGKLIMLKKKHDAEQRQRVAQGKNLSKEDMKEVVSLVRKQQAGEEASLTQLLRLKQDEEQEKLRKEYATKKIISLKGLQQSYADQAILQGKLDEDQARALLMEHHQSTATLEKLMDEEMSRQRMALEEKLARRKLLTKATESQADHHSVLLNAMATQTLSAVSALEESEQLSREEAQAHTDRLLQEVRGIKENYEKERTKQEQGLHKRLSEQKKRRMAEKEKENKQKLEEFEKEKKARVQNGELDASDYLSAKSSLMASHRTQLAELETEMDEEAREDLEKLRDEMAGKIRSQITGVRDKLHASLDNKGLTEKQAREIVEQHERNVEELLEQRQEQRQKQELAIKKRLAKHRKELALRKQLERDEREQIREHEEKMVGRLLASQVAMSEEERRKILAEHEQHVVAMENSLALTKLRQRRLLEEKMAQRKGRQMDRLARKQEQEAKRKLQERRLDETDDDEGDSGLKAMMQKHTEERMVLMTREEEDADKLEEEMEAVRSEMLSERANALKDQEDRLGAVMAQLQMEKARELATIEEQQKALLQLKMNMLDELTEKGIMKNAQCKKVIETHQKQVEALEQKLKKGKAKAEAQMRKKLQEKAAEREKSLMLRQEAEMERLLDREKNGTAARLKKVALKHKHMVQMEEFRNKLEIEMVQSMEEIRRQAEVVRLQQQQDQDLEFLSALVRVGRYDRSELINVLHLLFPVKSHDQINKMLAKLYEKVDEEEERSSPASNKGVSASGEGRGRLEDRVKTAILDQIPKAKTNSPVKKKKNKSKQLAPLRSAEAPNKGALDRDVPIRRGAALPKIVPGHRPDPVGASSVQDSDSDRSRRYDDEEERSDGEGEEETEDYGKYSRRRSFTQEGQRRRKKGGVAY